MSDLRTLVQAYDPHRSLARAETPPSAWYTDPRFDALERDAVFARAWQPVARLDELATEGEFVASEVAREPVVAVRSGSGIGAFYNVCRHHAAQVATGTGCAKRLVCPYHGWSYGLDGRLLGTPRFDGAEDFDPARNGLLPVRAEAWGHWLFVNISGDAPPLAGWLGELAGAFESRRMASLAFFERREYALDCNWKVFVDNYLDGGYHVPLIHKGLAGVLDNRAYTVTTADRHAVQSAPMNTSETATGKVRGGEAAWYAWQYPNFMLNCYDGVMDTNLVLPDGPGRCRVIVDFWFEDVSGSARERNEASVAIADEIQREDMGICASVQRGLHSRVFDTGRLSPEREAGEHLFHRLLHADLERAMHD